MKRLLLTLFASLMLLSSSAQEFETFVRHFLNTYPQARLLDIYKGAFQDFMGAEHLISDSVSVARYFYSELSIAEQDACPVSCYEPCGVSGSYVRVYLCAVTSGKIPAQLLLNAFLQSATTGSVHDVDEWKVQWQILLKRIELMELELSNFEADRHYIDQLLSQGRYAISHSADFREAYKPHYRVVEKNIFNNCILPLLQ